MAAMALESKQDSQKFGEMTEDNVIRGEMQGGYTVTRPRYTRKAIQTWKTGFTWLDDTDMGTWRTFYDTVETHSIFQWTHPTTSVTYDVRFAEPPKITFEGRGALYLWSIDIILQEV